MKFLCSTTYGLSSLGSKELYRGPRILSSHKVGVRIGSRMNCTWCFIEVAASSREGSRVIGVFTWWGSDAWDCSSSCCDWDCGNSRIKLITRGHLFSWGVFAESIDRNSICHVANHHTFVRVIGSSSCTSTCAVDVCMVVVSSSRSTVTKARVKTGSLIGKGKGTIWVGKVIEECTSCSCKTYSSHSCSSRTTALYRIQRKLNVLISLTSAVGVALELIMFCIMVGNLRWDNHALAIVSEIFEVGGSRRPTVAIRRHSATSTRVDVAFHSCNDLVIHWSCNS